MQTKCKNEEITTLSLLPNENIKVANEVNFNKYIPTELLFEAKLAHFRTRLKLNVRCLLFRTTGWSRSLCCCMHLR